MTSSPLTSALRGEIIVDILLSLELSAVCKDLDHII